MKLSLEQIKSITTGAVRVKEEQGKIRFFRFTQEQESLYKRASIELNRSFYDRCAATAGIRMMFKTNSQTLGLVVEVLKCTSRRYFSFDLFVNGKAMGALDNFSEDALPRNYTEADLPLGRFSKEFALGAGVKEICIYFPWSVCPLLEELSLEEGSFIEAVKPAKKLLAFGDSITQGYDALRPSMRYAARLADHLGAEEINKGIGGEIFFPPLAELKEDFSPDYITVAYGTNDWGRQTQESFYSTCKAFYEAISKHYPTAKIFAITPIWRADYTRTRDFGPFKRVEEIIGEAVSHLPNVTVLRGFDLVPKEEKYFADLRLHPNDNGFKYYADNLYNELRKTL